MRGYLLAAGALLVAGMAQAQVQVPVTSYTLDNGMEVVVIEDHRAPIVQHMVWYRAGGADETAGNSGVAHFLEHLMFRGTETFADGEIDAIVTANGGSHNAFTSWDATGYYQRVAADRLELMMQIEADRMVNLKMDEDIVATERQVVIEERGRNVDSNVGRQFSEQRLAAQFINHRYGTPVLGWEHEIEALTLQDAQDFYDTYYAPNNAILIVAGDVVPEEVLALAQQYYGPLPANPDLPERMRAQEPPQLAARVLRFEDPRVSDPTLQRTYLAPERDPGDQEAAAALKMLAYVLAGSSFTSVFAQELELEREATLYSWAYYWDTSLDDTLFGLGFVPHPDYTLEEAEAIMDEVIAEFIEGGVDDAQLERIKGEIRASLIYEQDNVGTIARRYGDGLTQGLTIEDIQAWPDLLLSVTPEQVVAAAEMIFVERNSVTGYMTAPGMETTDGEPMGQ